MIMCPIVEPQTPGSQRTRRYPRLELHAQVRLPQGTEGLLLPVRNVSRGGVLVAAAGHDLSAFRISSPHPLELVDPDGTVPAATLEARVVRHDAIGMALSWDHSDAAVVLAGVFLDAFYSKR
jgi:hypothetical protein